MMKIGAAIFAAVMVLAFAALLVQAQSPINQSAYSQTTTVPFAYRVIVGILLIVILVVLVWKALRYLIGAIFIIIILLIVASTAYYFFKTGSVSISYSLGFLSNAASGLSKYLPIPSLYNSTIGAIGNLTTTVSSISSAPYVSASQAKALMGVNVLSKSYFGTYSNYSTINKTFGSIFASSSSYAWQATYISGNRNLSETVFLSSNSQSLYDYMAITLYLQASLHNETSPYNGIANGMNYTYTFVNNANVSNTTGLYAWKDSHFAMIIAKGMHPNATSLAAAVSSSLG